MKKKIIIIVAAAILVIGGIVASLFFVNSKKEEKKNASASAPVDTDYLAYIETDDENNCSVYLDKNGNVKKISNEDYSLTKDFNHNCLLVRNDSGDNVVIDSDLNVIIDKSYKVQEQNGTFFTVRKDGKEGVIDINKKAIVPTEYENIKMLKFDDEELMNLHIIIAKNSDETFDIYFNDTGKIASKKEIYDTYFGTISYYIVDGISAGIIKYLNEEQDEVYISSVDGSELAVREKNSNKQVNINENCIIVTEDSKSTIQFFDDSLKLTKKLEEVKGAAVAGKFVIVRTKTDKGTKADVYDETGEIIRTFDKNIYAYVTIDNETVFYNSSEIFNSSFEKIIDIPEKGQIYSPSVRNLLIYIKTDKKYTAYNTDGSVLLEDVDRVDSSTLIKGDKTYFICGKTLVEQREGSKAKNSCPERGKGSNKYELSYDDGFQIYDAESKSVIWDYKGKETFSKKLQGVNVLNVGTKYYDYNGKLVYEK